MKRITELSGEITVRGPFQTDPDPFEGALRDFCARLGTTQSEYLEKMAAAYYLETKVPPSRSMLVEQRMPNGSWRFWFQERDDAAQVRG